MHQYKAPKVYMTKSWNAKKNERNAPPSYTIIFPHFQYPPESLIAPLSPLDIVELHKAAQVKK